jgi:hypothetical protein
LSKLTVTSAPAGTVMVLLSKATFLATRSMVTLFPDVEEDGDDEESAGVDGGVAEGEDEHATKPTILKVNNKTRTRVDNRVLLFICCFSYRDSLISRRLASYPYVINFQALLIKLS